MFHGFTGVFYHAIDAKGRIIIPTKFREKLQGQFWLTRGIDDCLYLMTNEDWETMVMDIKGRSWMNNQDLRKLERGLVAFSSECELDKQGRILVPPAFRKLVPMDKEIVLAGQINRIEIWDKDKWEASIAEIDLADITGRLNDSEQPA
ncbi:MAG: division/cell wall cluster transcriptional repressor MraZ [Lachnospiraceae bacterium]|nr:division/cell wall cluster transcriptional repressor MraZ [Lachnospiraceae bacterium]MDY5742734.1 division/cell wall cluster transcriptional repressor MraZ [Lachnospiraceae bacterium]